jgi:hypothetical protein
MDELVPVYTAVHPPRNAEPAPVLAMIVGAERRPRPALVAAILGALGEDAVVVPLFRNMLAVEEEDPRVRYREVGKNLAAGRSVLVSARGETWLNRRALLDVAARHLAWTMALVTVSNWTLPSMVAQAAGEGWHAVVVLR